MSRCIVAWLYVSRARERAGGGARSGEALAGPAVVSAIGRVGAAWYRLFTQEHPGFGYVDDSTPELAIAVVPSRRGHGFGGELMDALLARARSEGYHAISLSVDSDSPAVHLYQRYGFEKLDERDGATTMKAALA